MSRRQPGSVPAVSTISIRRASHCAGVSRSSAANRSADDRSQGSHVRWSARSMSGAARIQPSPRALEFAANGAEVYLAWIQPLDEIAKLLERVRTAYHTKGRRPVFGLRTHLVVRATEREAWEAADELMSQVDDRVVAQRQAAFAGTPMVGQQAQLRAELRERSPRLWNGISKVRVNLGTAIVGDPEQVTEELAAYWRLGLDEFILSGFPHVEECRRVASEVLPGLRAAIERERVG